MMTFIDGPAQGHSVNLPKTKIFLRVAVKANGSFMALCSPHHEQGVRDRLYVYVAHKRPEVVYSKEAGRYVTKGEYKHLDEAIPLAALRDWASWDEWARANTDRLLPEWARGMVFK